MSIEGKKNGQIIITYRDKVRKMTKEIKTIVFRVNTNRMWRKYQLMLVGHLLGRLVDRSSLIRG